MAVSGKLPFVGELTNRRVFMLSRLAQRRRLKLQPAADPVTQIHKKPSVDFSLTGLIYCSMMMFMGLAAINSQANLLFAVFGLMIGILLISGVLCRIVLGRLQVLRVLPDQMIVGQPTTIQYQFTNAKRFWPSFSVSLAELDGGEGFTRQVNSYMLHAAPKMTAVVPVEVMPKRRGLYRLNNYQISTSFPFGFIKRALTRHQQDSVLIYPPVGKMSPRFLSLCRSADRSGTDLRPRRNGSDEFYGVREFREGENPRLIYWKRSARTGTLVSKEMAQISPPRLMILVDTFQATGSMAELALIERCVAMASSLASYALDSGMAVGFCAWANGWLLLEPQRGKRHCRDVLAGLACLPANKTESADPLLRQAKSLLRHGVTPVLFTPRPMSVGLADQARSNLVVINAGSPQGQSSFAFDPAIDFTRCMPWDQQVEKERQRPAAAGEPAPPQLARQGGGAAPQTV